MPRADVWYGEHSALVLSPAASVPCLPYALHFAEDQVLTPTHCDTSVLSLPPPGPGQIKQDPAWKGTSCL